MEPLPTVDKTSTEMALFVDQIVESGQIRRNRRRFSLFSSTKSSTGSRAACEPLSTGSGTAAIQLTIST